MSALRNPRTSPHHLRENSPIMQSWRPTRALPVAICNSFRLIEWCGRLIISSFPRFKPWSHLNLFSICRIASDMKTEEKNSSPKVRIAVLGNMNVGKSGKSWLIQVIKANCFGLFIISRLFLPLVNSFWNYFFFSVQVVGASALRKIYFSRPD